MPRAFRRWNRCNSGCARRCRVTPASANSSRMLWGHRQCPRPRQVTESDRVRINVLVLAGVFLILLMLVRKPWLAGYLLVTVLFSYYATLGATTLMATWWTGRAFGEVDWRVPFFLFTILVAVGEDYNILLITRAFQGTQAAWRRRRHAPALSLIPAARLRLAASSWQERSRRSCWQG